jgi:hypothetical protein
VEACVLICADNGFVVIGLEICGGSSPTLEHPSHIDIVTMMADGADTNRLSFAINPFLF